MPLIATLSEGGFKWDLHKCALRVVAVVLILSTLPGLLRFPLLAAVLAAHRFLCQCLLAGCTLLHTTVCQLKLVNANVPRFLVQHFALCLLVCICSQMFQRPEPLRRYHYGGTHQVEALRCKLDSMFVSIAATLSIQAAAASGWTAGGQKLRDSFSAFVNDVAQVRCEY